MASVRVTLNFVAIRAVTIWIHVGGGGGGGGSGIIQHSVALIYTYKLGSLQAKL